VTAPKIQKTWTQYLKSIPTENRYQLSGIDNPDDFLSNLDNRKPKYLFDYNPSIVIIPEHEKQHSFKHPTTGKITTAVYLASYRVSNYFWCIGHEHFKKFVHRGPLEFMGLAYLNEEFEVLAESIFQVMGIDIRLTTVPSTIAKRQQIYITYSVGVAVQKFLWLNEPTTKLKYEKKQPKYTTSSNQPMPPIDISAVSNCLTVTNAKMVGKNTVYFEDATITSESMSYLDVDGVNYTTTHITPPVTVAVNLPPQDDGTHEVSFMELDKPAWCPGSVKNGRSTDGESVSGAIEQSTTTSRTTTPIQPSYYTMEEQWFGENLISHLTPWENDRNSACCLEMTDPRTNKNVFVGIMFETS
jgi:hypothetical protein